MAGSFKDLVAFDLTPGNKKSVELGCTCPTHANGYGRGAVTPDGEKGWLIDEDCPIHVISDKRAKEIRHDN